MEMERISLQRWKTCGRKETRENFCKEQTKNHDVDQEVCGNILLINATVNIIFYITLTVVVNLMLFV